MAAKTPMTPVATLRITPVMVLARAADRRLTSPVSTKRRVLLGRGTAACRRPRAGPGCGRRTGGCPGGRSG